MSVCNQVWDDSGGFLLVFQYFVIFILGRITWPVFAEALARMISEKAGIEEDRYKETFRV